MSQKITISIPDYIHKRLESYRNRINISNVSTNALIKAMDDIEIGVKEAKKRFHVLSVRDATSLAFKRGVQWAANEATPEELAIVCLWEINEDKVPEIELFKIKSKKIENLIKPYDWVEDFINEKKYMDDILSPFAEAHFNPDCEYPDQSEEDYSDVINAFIEGVKVIWDELGYLLIAKIKADE